MQVSKLALLDSVSVVNVVFHSYGASTASENGDPGINISDEHRKVVKLGTKSSIDIKHLNQYKAARKWIHRRALECGTEFLGGYLMSPENAKIFISEVNDLFAKLNIEVESLIQDFPNLVNAWALQNPEYAAAIRSSAPSTATVRSRFKFGVRCFKVASSGDNTDAGLEEEVSGIAGQILSEIAKDVRLTWKDRGYGAQQIKKLLKRISKKSESLSFINSDLSKITKLIDETLSALPPTGKIEDTQYLQLKGLFDMLMDPREMLNSIKQDQLAIVIQDDVADEAEAQAATATQVVEADAATADATQVADAAFDTDYVEVLVEQAKNDDQPAQATVTPVTTPVELNSSWNW
jgi:hypothetical protein